MSEVKFFIRKNENGSFDILTRDSIYISENKFDISYSGILGACQSITFWCMNTDNVEPKQAVFVFL